MLSSVIRKDLGLDDPVLVTLEVSPHSNDVETVVISGLVMVRHAVAMLLSE